LKKAIDVDSELISGKGGVFEVTVDGAKIFSKKALGRFPEDGEVLGLIRAR
jgi:selenoprotein W-related protein